MKIEKSIPLLEDILSPWQAHIGNDFNGYRNHVYRIVHCCLALQPCSTLEKEKIIIAAVFHDLGIWLDDTMDYLPPSLPPMMSYLKKRGLEAWATEIKLMITEHHKLSAFDQTHYPLVELFRKADLVDFSLGLFKFGIPNAKLKALKREFPNAGFHACLVRRSTQWFLKHPFDPLPMYKR